MNSVFGLPQRLLFLFITLLIVAGSKTSASDTTQIKPIAPHLTAPLKFADFTVTNINNLKAVSNLMNQKVYIGEESAAPEDYDWLVKGQSNTVHAQTIEEFQAKVENRCLDETCFGRAKYQWVETCSAVLNFMAQSHPSTNSFLGHNYFRDLPGSFLLGSLSNEQESQLDHDKLMLLKVRDYAKTGQTLHLTDFQTKDGGLTFSDKANGIDYLVKELARGDFNGDGCEDALIEIGWQTEGTLGGSFTEIVTRTRPDRDPKFVATDDFLKCSPHIVELVGTIEAKTFPGPPNYKDIKRGDEPEEYWILKLREPIDVVEDPEYPAPDENSALLDVSEVQLNLDVYLEGDYKAYQQFLNKRVVVRGELSQGFTVHHKTAIVIWVRDIKAGIDGTRSILAIHR